MCIARYIYVCLIIHVHRSLIHSCIYIGQNIFEQCFLMVNGKNQIRGMAVVWIQLCIYRVILHVYSELETDEFSYNTYKAYLQYLYTDSVNMSPEEAVGEFFMQCLCMYVICSYKLVIRM